MAATADSARLLGIIDAMLAELRPGRAARATRLDDALDTDLGIDSLSRVELAARIERAFGARLPDEAALTARTPRALLAVLGLAPGAGHGLDGAPVEAPPEAPPEAPREVAGVPAAAATLVDVFAWQVERHADREHVTLLEGDDVRATASYGTLWDEAHEVAAGLAARGIARGDTVALMLPTGIDFFRVFLGAMLAGAVPVPLYPPTRWSQIEEHVRGRAAILASCGARILVTVREALFVGRILRAQLGLDAVVPDQLRGTRARLALRAAAGSDLAMLQYTSGSTGDPKGVMLTHDNLLANIRAIGRAVRATSADRFVSWLPLYHDMGLIGAWMATGYHAIPLVLMPPQSFLARPVRWLRAIHRFRGTLSAAPNFAYEMAATKIADDELAGLDLASWRIAFNGAEPVRASTLARFAARMARCSFDAHALTPVYGLAEAAVGLTFPPLARGPRIDRIDARILAREGRAQPVADAGRAGVLDVVACGSALEGHDVRVVAGDGREAPPRIEGRIEFRGPSATRGYFRNARATTALLRDGWLDTGDVGYLADGELFVVSRVKDLIKRGGHNVHPYDLEAAAGEVPGIRKGGVAVFGTHDGASGSERIVVVAETSERDAAQRAALVARLQALAAVHLGGPANEIVLAPPHTVRKTSSGKIRRVACRELYERGLLIAPRHAVAWQLVALALSAATVRLRRGVAGIGDVLWGGYAAIAFVGAAALGLALLAVTPGAMRRQRLVHAVARLLVRAVALPLRVDGLAHVPRDGGALVAVNHASYVDAIVLAAALPSGWRFVAKRSFARVPIVAFAMHRAGVFFVEREHGARGIADTQALAAALRAGQQLVYFPEGTFTRAAGLRPFRLGGFSAAALAGAPIVPAVLNGTRAVLRDGHWRPRRRDVALHIEPALAPGAADWSAVVRMRDRVRAAMLARLDEPDLSDSLP